MSESMLEPPHHPRCVQGMADDAGPDEGETSSAFAERARGFRCTCRDLIALALAPRLEPFVRAKLTPIVREAIRAQVDSFMRELQESTRMQPEYDVSEPALGRFQVTLYPLGRAAYERQRDAVNKAALLLSAELRRGE